MRQGDQKYNKLWVGMLVGVVFPIMAYGILLFLLDLTVRLELFGNSQFADSFRTRTLSLIALATNALAMQYFFKRYMTNAMRGIIFPTLIYAGLWLYMFFDLLF